MGAGAPVAPLTLQPTAPPVLLRPPSFLVVRVVDIGQGEEANCGARVWVARGGTVAIEISTDHADRFPMGMPLAHRAVPAGHGAVQIEDLFLGLDFGADAGWVMSRSVARHGLDISSADDCAVQDALTEAFHLVLALASPALASGTGRVDGALLVFGKPCSQEILKAGAHHLTLSLAHECPF